MAGGEAAAIPPPRRRLDCGGARIGKPCSRPGTRPGIGPARGQTLFPVDTQAQEP
jgi:hypothetical protein